LGGKQADARLENGFSFVHPYPGFSERVIQVLDIVPLFVNTMAFNCRSIPDRCVARRPNSAAIVASLALRSARLGNLGGSPYLRKGYLGTKQY
jgi:hypothetical protein